MRLIFQIFKEKDCKVPYNIGLYGYMMTFRNISGDLFYENLTFEINLK